MEPEFVGGKHHLHEVKAQFPADRYVHVGDTEVDERYALLAGFDFLHVEQLELPVVADAIHDAAGCLRPDRRGERTTSAANARFIAGEPVRDLRDHTRA